MLTLKNVAVEYKGNKPVFKNLNLELKENEVLILSGENGSGKTTLAKAIMGMLSEDVAKVSGEIIINNTKIVQKSTKENKIHKKNFISIMPQNAYLAFDPLKKVGKQIILISSKILKTNKKNCKFMLFNYLIKSGFDDPDRTYNLYPHQLSQGMAQRLLFILSVITKPKLLILDEPTASVDRENAIALLNLACDYQKENNSAVIIITHNENLVKSVFPNAKTIKMGDFSVKNN